MALLHPIQHLRTVGLLRQASVRDAPSARSHDDRPARYSRVRSSSARLTRTLARVEVVELDRLGHMGPVTHPDIVNEQIVRFVDRT